MFPPLYVYSVYKSSDTEFLGAASTHWEVRRLRNIVVPDSVRVGLCIENSGIPREQML